jgi:hypothetical protein
VAVAVVHSGEPADQERPVVALEVIPPRPLERRLKASGEPMERPTMAMWPEAAVVVLAGLVLGGFGERMVMAMPPLPHPVATEARVSATPFQEQRSTTVAVAVVEPTTIQDFRQHPVVTEGSVGVATAPDRIERKALREQTIPAVVVVVAMRKARVGRADPAW